MKKPHRILVADDNQEILSLVSFYLKSKEFKITLVRSGEEALNKVSQQKFDLILLDAIMPGINGYEVCRQLKKNDQSKKIPVIFLTAKREEEDILEGFNSGGVDYILKPFKKDDLIARINNQLQISYVNHLMDENAVFFKNSHSQVINLLFNLSRSMEKHSQKEVLI